MRGLLFTDENRYIGALHKFCPKIIGVLEQKERKKEKGNDHISGNSTFPELPITKISLTTKIFNCSVKKIEVTPIVKSVTMMYEVDDEIIITNN